MADGRDSDALYKAVLETVVDGIVVIGDDGRIREFNRAAQRLFQYSRDEVVGQNVSMLMGADHASAHDGYLRRYLTSGEARIVGKGRRVDGRRKDGTSFPFWLGISRLEVDGRVLFAGVIHDLSQIQTVLDVAVDGIVQIDLRGVVTTFNASAARMFQYEPCEVLGQNVSMLMASGHSSRHDGYIRRYLQSGEGILKAGREVLGRRKDGSEFPLWLGLSEMKTGTEGGFVGILHDLTELREAQSAIVQSKTLASLGELAASVAHEIKNPIAAISSAMQVLEGSFDDGDRRREIAGLILDRLNSMDGMVRNLLEFARPPKPVLRRVHLIDVVEPIISLLNRATSHVRLEVVGDRGVTADVDPELLQRVILNLANNAVEAVGPEGGVVQVALEACGDKVCITVMDQGAGMAPEVVTRLFEPFFTTKPNGTGLGLPISMRIVEAHGGKIEVESELEQGTSFRIELPLAA